MNVTEFVEAAGNANVDWLVWITLGFVVERFVGWFIVFLFVAVHAA